LTARRFRASAFERRTDKVAVVGNADLSLEDQVIPQDAKLLQIFGDLLRATPRGVAGLVLEYMPSRRLGFQR
jgi:hypothetical protein